MESRKLIAICFIIILIIFGVCTFLVLNKSNDSSDSKVPDNSNINDSLNSSNVPDYIDGEIIENRTIWDDGSPVDGEVYLVKKSDGSLVCYDNGIEYPESHFY